MKCNNCVFWVEAKGTKKSDNIGGCTFGANNYTPMFLEEDCSLKDIYIARALELNDKAIVHMTIPVSTCLKIYHTREDDGSMNFDLVIVDKDAVLSEIREVWANKHDIPKYQVIITYLYGNDDHEEIEMCEPLSKLLATYKQAILKGKYIA